MSGERFLVTGAYGCIGAWVVRELVGEGGRGDRARPRRRPAPLRLSCRRRRDRRVRRVARRHHRPRALERALDEHAITHVIHLAALQVPFCRADPPLGARVNVARHRQRLRGGASAAPDRIGRVVYASSIAAYDALEDGDGGAEMTGMPGTLYGVYKRANEGTAHVYWAETRRRERRACARTRSTAPGRDQGADLGADDGDAGRGGGPAVPDPVRRRRQFQYAPDVARAFVAAAPRRGTRARPSTTWPGRASRCDEVVAAIEAAAPESRGPIGYDDVAAAVPRARSTQPRSRGWSARSTRRPSPRPWPTPWPGSAT